MSAIRVVVSGAAGRMGRAAVRAISRESDMRLVAALGRQSALGRDAGEAAGAGAVDAGDEIEDGGLAGAVGADQADDLALLDVEGEIVDGAETAEVLGQTRRLEKRHPSITS